MSKARILDPISLNILNLPKVRPVLQSRLAILEVSQKVELRHSFAIRRCYGLSILPPLAIVAKLGQVGRNQLGALDGDGSLFFDVATPSG
jgi:hypothetical protein